MTERFTASNGWHVEDGKLRTPGGFEFEHFDGPGVQTALIEYGRHLERTERDVKLGRWRSKAHPDYVVYPWNKGHVVIDERTGEREYYSSFLSSGRSISAKVIREYFDAQEPPKPWLDAKPGEAWVLRYDGKPGERAMFCQEFLDGPGFTGGEREYHGVDNPYIVAGERIWPRPEADAEAPDRG